jgi:phage I-like protein
MTKPAAFRLPADGWYQLAPAGEFPVLTENGRVVQVLDADAFGAMLDAFRETAAVPDFPGLLVDYDHFSLDLGKASEAAGWLVELGIRDSALWGRIRWSERGERAVAGGAYRFLSPVFDRASAELLGADRVRPRRLLSAGLTNDPNLKGLRPLSNRNGGNPPPNQEAARMKQRLAEILELGPEAPETDFVAKVQELKNRAVQTQTDQEELAALRRRNLEARIEADIEEHRDKIADAAQAREALLANREAALGILAAVRPPSRPAPLPNRREGRVPAADPGDQTAPAAGRTAAAIRNRAAEIQHRQGVNYRTAFRLAAQELAANN